MRGREGSSDGRWSGWSSTVLLRGFVGLGMDDPAWQARVFCRSRDRFSDAAISARFLAGIVSHSKMHPLLNREHFSVDGTLIEARASMNSFRRKDGDGRDGEPGAATATTTFVATSTLTRPTRDPEARLFRKGNAKESRLCYLGHAVMAGPNSTTTGP